MYLRIIKKITLYLLATSLICWLGFRFSPYLFPITKQDLQKEQFHSVKFFDRHGDLLQEVLSENSGRSVQVSIEDISPYFVDAIIAAEDKHFYQHGGLDYSAIFRALWQNFKIGKVVSGASTISMQLARLIHPKERTLFNKIREIYFAFRLEAGMEKSEILENYINRLPMGGNLYGVESAARAYFGISASDLTLAQATLLASIPNAPSQMNPYHDMNQIKFRQRIVLNRMAKLDMIPKNRVDEVIKETIHLKPQDASFLAPHFVFGLMEKLQDNVHKVKTTIDAQIQKMMTEQIGRVIAKLRHFHVSNAAAILLDNRFGDVLAYVGSSDFFNPLIDGQVDGVRALRQPGSTLKPFLYLLAMENGFHPASVVSDIPTYYSMPTGMYKPTNYSEDFRGPVRLREALANSLNVPAVRTLAKIGTDRFLSRLKAYGFHSLTENAAHYGVGLTLGGGEVSLYELTRAYRCLANKGEFTPVKEILGTDKNKNFNTFKKHHISTPELNYLITDILSDYRARTAEFGFHSVLNLPFPCAAKTGTSFRFCDNWTVGYTRDYTLGVWVGNFDHSPMMKVSGVTGAGPIFANIMLMLYADEEYPEKFQKTNNIVKVEICPVSGKRPAAYCPSSIEELIPKKYIAEFENQFCDMHVKMDEKIRTVVPTNYSAWAKGLNLNVDSQKSSLHEFQIVNPQSGSIYQRLPNLAPDFQSIRVQLEYANTEQSVNWFLNDSLIRTTRNEHAFIWQVIPGTFVLKAESRGEAELSSEVKFIVE